MKVFYGVRPLSSELAAALDVIRYMAEPDNLRQSHITLRGPYTRTIEPENLTKLNASIPGRWLVKLDGPGDFFSATQCTVFIKVDLQNLSELVWKPHFRGGQPHVTLYDGRDRSFAQMLLNLLYRFDLHRDLPVSKLERLPTKAPLGGNFAVLYNEFGQAYRKYLGVDHDLVHAENMTADDKLSIIERVLLANFPTIYSRLSPPAAETDRGNYCFDFGELSEQHLVTRY